MSLRAWQQLLAPLSGPFMLALAAKNHAYERGWVRPDALRWPVVSIGNISVGGAGKTPFVIELARLLIARGIHVDVLSRGYGRRSPAAVERVPAEGGSAERYGDEPILIGHAAHVPVYVGASRYAAGLLAEGEWAAEHVSAVPPCVHLLDDGFQHRKLARAVDLVLLHPRDYRDLTLPAGRLREPLWALERADVLLLRADDAESEPALLRAGIRKPVWRVRRVLEAPPVAGPVVAFAAIAHPEEFFAELRATGLELTKTFAFRDHHRLRPGELEALIRAGRDAAGVVTTEKDLVRLTTAQRMALGSNTRLLPARLRAELLDAPRCMLDLHGLIGSAQASGSMRR